MKEVLNLILSLINKILEYNSRDEFVESIETIKIANSEFKNHLNSQKQFILKDLWEWRKSEGNQIFMM